MKKLQFLTRSGGSPLRPDLSQKPDFFYLLKFFENCIIRIFEDIMKHLGSPITVFPVTVHMHCEMVFMSIVYESL